MRRRPARGIPALALLCEKYHNLGRFAVRDNSPTLLAGKTSRVPLSGPKKARTGPANKSVTYRSIEEKAPRSQGPEWGLGP